MPPETTDPSLPLRTRRGTALCGPSSWCSPPERKPCSSGQRWLCCRRLDCATPTTGALSAPSHATTAARRPRGKRKCAADRVDSVAWASLAPSTVASIVDLAVAIAELEACGVGAGTTASALPSARAALAQSHGLSRLAAAGGRLLQPGDAEAEWLEAGRVRRAIASRRRRPRRPARSDRPAVAVRVIGLRGMRSCHGSAPDESFRSGTSRFRSCAPVTLRRFTGDVVPRNHVAGARSIRSGDTR